MKKWWTWTVTREMRIKITYNEVSLLTSRKTNIKMTILNTGKNEVLSYFVGGSAEQYTTLENKPLWYAKTWSLRPLRWTESFAQKRTYCIIPFIWSPRSGKTNLCWNNQSKSCLWKEVEVEVGLTENGHEVTQGWWRYRIYLKRGVGICEISQNCRRKIYAYDYRKISFQNINTKFNLWLHAELF